MSKSNKLFLKYLKKVAKESGQLYNILRPNYGQVDNSPATVYTNKMYRVEPSQDRFGEPKFKNVDFYSIFGDRALIQPGDILQQVDEDGTARYVTVLHFGTLQEAIGIRTGSIAKITEDTGTDVYTSVYYDSIGVSFPGSALEEAMAGSLKIPNKRFCLFKRDNISTNKSHPVGMRLIETDGTVERRWTIQQTDGAGNLIVLTVEEDTA